MFSDPTGERYKRCTGQGDNEKCEEISDAAWDQYKESNRRELIFTGGNIFARDKDGNQGAQVGTYKQLDVDLSPFAIGVAKQVSAQAGPPVRFFYNATMAFLFTVGPGTIAGATAEITSLGLPKAAEIFNLVAKAQPSWATKERRPAAGQWLSKPPSNS